MSDDTTTISLDFFRATATVIPTLLIAVVLTGRLLDRFDLGLDGSETRGEQLKRIKEFRRAVYGTTAAISMAFVGEVAALAALVSGKHRVLFLAIVLVSLGSILGMLSTVMFRGLIEN